MRTVNELLSQEGCSCDCGHDAEGHDEDCDRCFACRVERAIKGQDDGAEPGEPIGACCCPCCGANLEIQHGDESDQIAAVGSRSQSESEREWLDDIKQQAVEAIADRLFVALGLIRPQNIDPVLALEADIGRLLDVERRWSEACKIARAHCPVGDGESHIREGIPRLARRAQRARREAIEECARVIEDFAGRTADQERMEGVLRSKAVALLLNLLDDQR